MFNRNVSFDSQVLAEKRSKLTDNMRTRLITEIHALHRSGYMGERLEYYKRIHSSLASPNEYMSIISDGMAQTHCQIPWMGNQYDFGSYLPQHLQGVLQHGKSFSCFRTFHNVKHGVNLNIYSILKVLRWWSSVLLLTFLKSNYFHVWYKATFWWVGQYSTHSLHSRRRRRRECL